MQDIKNEIKNKVLNELQSHPTVFLSMKGQIEEGYESMRVIGHKPRIFVTDMVTYIGASSEQRTVISKMIEKYGSTLLEEILMDLYNEGLLNNKPIDPDAWKQGLE